MKPLLSFVQFSDTHIGPDGDYTRYDHPALPSLERLIDTINAMPEPPDFLIHTGDVSHDRSPESYALAAEALARLQQPIYYVNGNHDRPAMIREYLHAPAAPDGDPAAPLDYAFHVKGERFLVLDGSNPDVPDPLGLLRESQLDYVRDVVASTDGPLTVLLHYVPFPMNSPWLDEHMILRNGDALHAILTPARDRLRGVFFGHLHRSCQIHRDGILYTCGPSTFVQYAWRPWEVKPEVDHDYPSSYNYVQYFRDRVIVNQYTF